MIVSADCNATMEDLTYFISAASHRFGYAAEKRAHLPKRVWLIESHFGSYQKARWYRPKAK
jgi:hypothetical protein